MINKIEGKSIQDGIPTPDNPVEIKSINLFEVNDIQYWDNLPNNSLIGVTKEQYCEYLQLKENKDKNWNELKEMLAKNVRDAKIGSGLSYYFTQVLMYMQEIESGKNE